MKLLICWFHYAKYHQHYSGISSENAFHRSHQNGIKNIARISRKISKWGVLLILERKMSKWINDKLLLNSFDSHGVPLVQFHTWRASIQLHLFLQTVQQIVLQFMKELNASLNLIFPTHVCHDFSAKLISYEVSERLLYATKEIFL